MVNTDWMDRLSSFDTETTGINPKSSGIWQVGMARQGSMTNIHTNPFTNVSPHNTTAEIFGWQLRDSNGRFSEKADEIGHFDELVQEFRNKRAGIKGKTPATLDKALLRTLGRMDTTDVLVMQNMNFENNMIAEATNNQDLPMHRQVSKKVSERLKSRMSYLASDAEGNTLNTLFHRPASVQESMRKADETFHLSFLRSTSEKSEGIFENYVSHLNSTLDNYKSEIENPNRKGIIAVELMDITKAAFGNAAKMGLIEKDTAQLGTNLDFLSQVMFDKAEDHTAGKDSQLTIDVFKRLWSVNEELRSGKVSTETKELFKSIRMRQPDEINKAFLKSINNAVNDYKIDSGSSIRTQGTNFFQPESHVLNTTTGDMTRLPKVQAGIGKVFKQNLGDTLHSILLNYSHYSEDIRGFNRRDYIDSIINGNHKTQKQFQHLSEKISDDVEKLEKHAHIGTKEENIIAPKIKTVSQTVEAKSFWNTEHSIFGMNVGKKSKIGMAGAALYLTGMALTPKPKQQLAPSIQDQQPVYTQFYNEPMLGSGIADWNERKKHHKM